MGIAVTRLFVLLTLLYGKVEAGDVCKEYNISELLVVLAAQGAKMHEISGKVEELEKLNGKYKEATDALKEELQKQYQETTDALKKEVQDNSCRIKSLEKKLEQGSSGEGWVMYNGSCYLFPRHNLTFSESQTYCKKFNAHLVHVNDEAENTFVKIQKGGKFWIGLSDNATEGDMRWVDDKTAPRYSDWAPEEPNDRYGKEDCVAVTAYWKTKEYLWNDLPCSAVVHPVCEMRISDGD